MGENLSITIKTKGTLPRVPFADIKNQILGENYDLSIAIIDTKDIHKINKETRSKDEPTDVLSFSLAPQSGEILLCPEMIAHKAPHFEKSYEEYFLFVVIHGMLHLKGFDHGSTMESEEKKWMMTFSSRI